MPWTQAAAQDLGALTTDTVVVQQLITGLLPPSGTVNDITCLMCDQIGGERKVTLVSIVYCGYAIGPVNTLYSATYFVHADEMPDDPGVLFVLAHENHNFAPWVVI